MKNHNPRQTLICLVVFAACVIVAFISHFVWASQEQSKTLITYEFSILLRGNRDQLQSGNYRAFVENITLPDSEFFLSIHDQGKPSFEYGNRDLGISQQCIRENYLNSKMVYCKRSLFSWPMFAVATSLFTILAIATFLILVHLNAQMVESFKNLFQAARIPFNDDLNFSEAWRLARSMADQFVQYQLRAVENEKRKTIIRIATQVAHDIRSPVTAINSAIAGTDILCEERRSLIQSASSRINAIAEDLLLSSRQGSFEDETIGPSNSAEMNSQKHEFLNVNPLVLEILAEKHLLYPELKIAHHGFEQVCRLRVEATGFQRMLANIIQNAVEAVKESADPRIDIVLRKYSDSCQIVIMDNGVGISASALEDINSGKISSTKKNGNGLGLSHATTKMREWDARMDISSALNAGTSISLIFRDSK